MLTGVLVSAVALVAVGAIVFSEARSTERRLTAWQLVLMLEIALVVFSFSYYLIATSDSAQFVGIGTRLDALYFATATASTVGYGDVHAAGQLARLVVTLHMAFNLVFIAAVVNLGRDWMNKQRTAGSAGVGEPDQDDSAGAHPARIFAFCAANSSSVRTPWSRSSPRPLSWVTTSVAGAAAGGGGGGGACAYTCCWYAASCCAAVWASLSANFAA